MTTRRENMFKVFRGEAPEWMPLTGHVDPYNQPNRKEMDPELAGALGEVEWNDESTIVFSRYLDLEITDWYELPVRVTQQNVAVERVIEGNVTTSVWHTPAGELRSVSNYLRDETGAVSEVFTEHMVKGPDDLSALVSIFEDQVVEGDPDLNERARKRSELIGDDGLLLGTMAGTPLGMMYRVYASVETLAFLWADAPDALRDCFTVMEANYLRCVEIGVQSDIDAVVAVDDTSTTAISPTMFETYNLDLTDKRAETANAAGKLYLHHSCGLIRNLLPLYRRTKMDGVHAFTPPPIGDVTIAEGLEALGDRITIMSGVQQLAESLEDRAAVQASIGDMIEQAKPWDHFILGLAAYPNRTMEQTRFVVECCREFGGNRPKQ